MAAIHDINKNITNLETALGKGVLSAVVDGITVTFGSATDLQSRLQYFKQRRDAETTGKRRRPVAASINLGGF